MRKKTLLFISTNIINPGIISEYIKLVRPRGGGLYIGS